MSMTPRGIAQSRQKGKGCAASVSALETACSDNLDFGDTVPTSTASSLDRIVQYDWWCVVNECLVKSNRHYGLSETTLSVLLGLVAVVLVILVH